MNATSTAQPAYARLGLLAAISALGLLAAPAMAKPRPVLKSAARYKVSLGDVGRVTAEVDAFAARITLKVRGAKRREQVLLTLREGLAKTPCPDVVRDRRDIVVRCKTRKISARIGRRGGKSGLIITQLRGMPTGPESSPVPLIPFAPELTYDLGGPCPGTTLSGRGECALTAGNVKEAETLFRASLGTLNHSHAAVRLGDLALRDGDVDGAVGWWRQAQKVGDWGRLARARECEVVGSCFDPLRPGHRYDPLNPVALPGTLYDEIVLRRARALVYEGRAAEAARFLVAPGTTTVNSHACRFDPELCQKVGVAAFDEVGTGVLPAGLVLHSHLAGHNKGAWAFAFADRAALHAERLGAPKYGANALAAVTESAPDGGLPDHLARTARLYLDGEDIARARIVLKFAQARYRRKMGLSPWPQLFDRLENRAPEYDASPDGLSEENDDVARARALLARLAKGREERANKASEAMPNGDVSSTTAGAAQPGPTASALPLGGAR